MSTPNPDGHRGIGLCIALTALMLIICSARLYTRAFIVHSLEWDDYTMAAAAVLAACLPGPIIAGVVNYGLGLPEELADVTTIVHIRRFTYANMIIFQFAIGLSKASLILTTRRFARSSNAYMYLLNSIVAFVALYTVSSTLALAFRCTPISAAWDNESYGSPGKCPGAPFYLTIILLNVITDFVVLVLPMPLLVRLRIAPAQRYLVLFLFALGSFSCSASLIRVFIVIRAYKYRNFWEMNVHLWAIIEVNIAIICGSIPPLNALFRHLWYGPAADRAASHQSTRSRSRPRAALNSESTSTQTLNRPGHSIWDGRARDFVLTDEHELAAWEEEANRIETNAKFESTVGGRFMMPRKRSLTLDSPEAKYIMSGPSGSSREQSSSPGVVSGVALRSDSAGARERNRPSSCSGVEGSKRSPLSNPHIP
ncbi:hypothetical protein BDZ91DRAFT_311987 [Kalaharituber pfeilii]|nr:hypothetical protein BDZ91DRAFT_311987 [Kalaharituber pfeilii]